MEYFLVLCQMPWRKLWSCMHQFIAFNHFTKFKKKFLNNSLIPVETLRLIEQSAQNDMELQGGFDGYGKCSKISKL
jgi:hypothetical protein